MLRATHAAEVSQMRRARASLMIRFTSSRTKADSSLDWRSSFMQRQRSCSKVDWAKCGGERRQLTIDP